MSLFGKVKPALDVGLASIRCQRLGRLIVSTATAARPPRDSHSADTPALNLPSLAGPELSTELGDCIGVPVRALPPGDWMLICGGDGSAMIRNLDGASDTHAVLGEWLESFWELKGWCPGATIRWKRMSAGATWVAIAQGEQCSRCTESGISTVTATG